MSEIIVTTKEELSALIEEKLKSVLSDIKQPAENNLVNIDEISKSLGVCRSTIHKWKKAGKIPFRRIGGRVYYNKTEVINASKKVHLI